MAWKDPLTSKREGYSSVTSSVTVVATSKREGYAGVGELIGYDEVYHDRTAYASVTQLVFSGAVSKREGYASVGELIGYDEIYHERTGYASVGMVVTFRTPDFDEVTLPIMGWGVPLQPAQMLTIFRGSAEGLAVVASNVVVEEHPSSLVGTTSVDNNVVSSV